MGFHLGGVLVLPRFYLSLEQGFVSQYGFLVTQVHYPGAFLSLYFLGVCGLCYIFICVYLYAYTHTQIVYIYISSCKEFINYSVRHGSRSETWLLGLGRLAFVLVVLISS